MKDNFVSYEIALKLKELGFKEECLGWYLFEIANKENISSVILASFIRNWNHYGDRINAPLYQQVFKWFREKHNLPSEVRFVTNLKVYDYRITKIDIPYNNSFYDGIKPCNAYITYEKAELACLKKLIEIIKRK